MQPLFNQPRASFLVRCWLESGEVEEAALVRGYIRNLATGEETFIADASACGEQILRLLRGDRAESGSVKQVGGAKQ